MEEQIGIGGIGGLAAGEAADRPLLGRVASIRSGGTDLTSPRLPRIPLGAELPIFCERCGYSLHALPQVRCDHCTLLQFHCPECGHHQPINTLRPAMQRTLGRLRAFAVGLSALFKLNWFVWLLFAWIGMGTAWAYAYDYQRGNYGPVLVSLEVVLAFTLFAVPFGMLSRLLLLRWRSGWLVGLVLASLTCLALYLGFHIRVTNFFNADSTRDSTVLTSGRALLIGLTFAIVLLAVAAAWPMWVGFVRVVMPQRAGSALLEWQRSLSDPAERTRLSDRA
ncbi:MAG TPA: zinc ribbon domain-containing protein [Tepidisphaeraceae bacterium]|nr:zinc ribbon domain-containing protein [Tepidisphaeraceae bacterium]